MHLEKSFFLVVGCVCVCARVGTHACKCTHTDMCASVQGFLRVSNVLLYPSTAYSLRQGYSLNLELTVKVFSPTTGNLACKPKQSSGCHP